MDTRDLNETARDHLLVDWVVVTPREGRRIDVDEEFDVQLSIRNGFGNDMALGFEDIEVTVEGTEYAEPVGTGSFEVDGRLGPGERAHLVVRFRALAADPLSEGTSKQEAIGQVSARARLVLVATPEIRSDPKPLTAQIHGESTPE